MKFSIIIPVYNVAPYLRECLDSLMAQTYTDWEAVCVDDGATDGSGEILDEYAAKDGRFSVIHQENAGVSAARNAALDITRGDWVGFIDADDYIDSNWLRQWAYCVSCCDVDVIRFSNPIIWSGAPSDLNGEIMMINGRDNVLRYVAKTPSGYKSCMHLFRRQLLGSHQYSVGQKVNEDVLFCVRLLLDCTNIAISTAKGYYYRQREDSAVHQISSDVDDARFFDALSKICDDNRGLYYAQVRRWCVLRVFDDLRHRLSHQRDGTKLTIRALRRLILHHRLNIFCGGLKMAIKMFVILMLGNFGWRLLASKNRNI